MPAQAANQQQTKPLFYLPAAFGAVDTWLLPKGLSLFFKGCLGGTN